MKRIIITTLVCLLIFGIGAGIIALLHINRPKAVTEDKQDRLDFVEWIPVTTRNLQLKVSSEGTVAPAVRTALVGEVSGRVIKRSPEFKTGGFFEKGDVLFEIEDTNYRAAVAQAKSQLAQAKLTIVQEKARSQQAAKDWKKLGKSGKPNELALRLPQMEAAEVSYDAMKANLEKAEKDLDKTKVIAPYSGRVLNTMVEVGMFITMGVQLGEIYEGGMMEVSLPLPVNDFNSLTIPLDFSEARSDASASVTLVNPSNGKKWSGEVMRSSGSIDSITRTVDLVAEVKGEGLAPGMFVEAEIGGKNLKDIATIPRSALMVLGQRTPGGRNAQVFVVQKEGESYQLYRRDVVVLRVQGEEALISSGLEAGELVSLTALDIVVNGMPVAGREKGSKASAESAQNF